LTVSFSDYLLTIYCQCLVAVGDKEESFIGSRKWIGSVEVGYVIDHLFAVCTSHFSLVIV